MSDDCIFCKIISGQIPCAKVYESPLLLGFLDIAPASPGHCLLVPKAHYENIFDLPADLGPEFLKGFSALGRAIMQAVNAQGLNIGMNNFKAAGQVVFHAHFHIIPRLSNDGLSAWPQKSYANHEEMNSLALSIRSKLA